ncbi:hypothetical protein N4S67_26135 [Mycobacterium sp. CPCC 205710]|uniref:DUF7159 domain-containing protein n=1 Tax=Mycobacterium deserti TaxID=2978347 RepID=A0ABT2MHY0_9MYCO|nr:hypothetical protein [Mycobacterium deserti]MCT7661881.1 hypothetical protein [Mycobacterium deserti]
MTPSAVGLVLVEGADADGATVDRDAIEILPGRRSSAQQTSEQAAAAVLRTEAIAAVRGHRVQSIGVTWSDDADTEASLLLRSLSDSGFDNVVPVRLPEATEALAWGIAEVIGHDITAVCVIEPETVIALIVHTPEGAVQTAVHHAMDSEAALIGWLSAVFTQADWQPEALVVVGSGGDFDALMPRLEDALSVPVFAPAEAELALARGAALASAHNTDLMFADDGYGDTQPERGGRRLTPSGPLAMLVAGAVTFVVSVSVAVSMEFAPNRDAAPAEPSPAAKSSAEAAAAPAASVPAAIPAPVAEAPPALPPPQAPPVDAAPPVELPAELPLAPVEAAPEAPPVDVAPAAPVAPLPPEAPVLPPQAPVVLPPESQAPGLMPAVPTPVPERRGFLQRIRDKFSDIGQPDVQQAPAPVPAPLAPDAPLPAPPPPPQ